MQRVNLPLDIRSSGTRRVILVYTQTKHRVDCKRHYVIPAKAGIQNSDMKQYFVYILASKKNGTLYIGLTNDLVEGFTKKYSVHILVYYEVFGNASDAITREKHMKKWNRQWKINLIEKSNPDWEDLYCNLIR